MPTSLDAAGLRRWAEHAVGVLAARRDDINALNVFPVADADTGSNMAFTMRAAAEEAAEQAAELDDALPADLAQALAVGAVRGARGNSGMVLSQVLRAIADEVGDAGLDGPRLARALARAVDYVHRAISQPVEGTIVTVLRAAAEGARAAVDTSGSAVKDARGAATRARNAVDSAGSAVKDARGAATSARGAVNVESSAATGVAKVPNSANSTVDTTRDKANNPAVGHRASVAGDGGLDTVGGARSNTLVVVLDAAIAAASEALEVTPSQLPALQEAGVVDAGGAGLLLVLAAMRDAVNGGRAENASGNDSGRATAGNAGGRLTRDENSVGYNVFYKDAPGNAATGGRPMDSGTAAVAGTYPGPGGAAATPHETQREPQNETQNVIHGAPAEIEVVFFFRGDLAVLEDALRPLGNSLVLARVNDDQASVHIHSLQAGRVIETAFELGEVDNLRLEALPATALGAPGGDTPPRRRTLFAAAPAGPVAELFASAGARVVEPGENIADAQEDDIVLRNGTRTRPGAAHMVDTGSLVAGIAAISVYDDTIIDTRDAVATMEDAAAAMRVDYPGEDTLGAILGTCRDLLFAGGEQITVLSPTHIDAAAMSAQLGVDVMALQVPGMRTEIGVE